jgi:hypothetical protein
MYRYAYVPEHLPDCVQAVAAAEPFFEEHHVCYLRGRHLIFIGGIRCRVNMVELSMPTNRLAVGFVRGRWR